MCVHVNRLTVLSMSTQEINRQTVRSGSACVMLRKAPDLHIP